MKKIYLAVFIVLLLSLSYIVIRNQKVQKQKDQKIISPVPTVREVKTVDFSNLMMTLTIPIDYTYDQRYTGVTLSKNNHLIVINRAATNFYDLDSYLEDISKKNQIKIENRESLKV